MATIDGYYFRVCTDGARRHGADVAALLDRAGIDPAAPGRPGWRGDVAAMARLVRDIRETLDDEFMGYTAQPMPVGAFAFACEIALDAPDIAAALVRAVRFYTLATRDVVTGVEVGERVTVTARLAEPALDPTRYFEEFWLMTWHRLACWLAGETVPMLAARFAYPRPRGSHLEEFRYLFPAPQRFDADVSAVELDRHALDGPIRRTRAELTEMLARAPLDIMTIPASDTGLARRVRRLLHAEPALAATMVAARLELSPDALRRRLRGEGTGLAAIRENVRRDAAMHNLSRSGISVETVAAALGYAEPRSFTRAFRQWTGTSPSAFRRRGDG